MQEYQNSNCSAGKDTEAELTATWINSGTPRSEGDDGYVIKRYRWNSAGKYIKEWNVNQWKEHIEGIVPSFAPHPEVNIIGELWSPDYLERLNTFKHGIIDIVVAVEHVTGFEILELLKTLTDEETCDEFLFKRVLW